MRAWGVKGSDRRGRKIKRRGGNDKRKVTERGRSV